MNTRFLSVLPKKECTAFLARCAKGTPVGRRMKTRTCKCVCCGALDLPRAKHYVLPIGAASNAGDAGIS